MNANETTAKRKRKLVVPEYRFYGDLDEPVVQLVRVLNGLPGMGTHSSCGGHDYHPHADQVGPGEARVNIVLGREGAASMELLRVAIDRVGRENIELRELRPEQNDWELKCNRGANPDVLAAMIKTVYEETEIE